MLAGRAFQTRAPATEKARRPTVGSLTATMSILHCYCPVSAAHCCDEMCGMTQPRSASAAESSTCGRGSAVILTPIPD